jgi:hypothetical protein
MTGTPPIYSIDSSALVFAWTDAYPVAHFATFWERLDALAREGRALVSDEVFEEMSRKDDDLYAWLKVRPQMVVAHTDDIQGSVRELLKSHPLLIKAIGTNRSGADPFVIALARCRNAMVISQERRGSAQKPKIPDVCDHYHVPCERLRHLITTEGWRF